MSRVFQILVSARALRLALAAGVVAALGACGQKGVLFLPTGDVAAARATLPQTLVPAAQPASAPPAAGTATPVRNP